jgi:hypothetical protein
MATQTYEVLDTTYHLHTEPDGSGVMEVRYVTEINEGERVRTFSEYLNFEGEKTIAERDWWRKRSPDAIPKTNLHAFDITGYHGVAATNTITVEYSSGGYRITNYGLGGIPPGVEKTW